MLAGAARGRYGGDRRRPVTGEAMRGSRRARRAAARKGASEAAAPRRRFPGLTSAAYGGSLRRFTLPRLLASVLRCSRPGRQARRAEGAPLMIVKKILTASTRPLSDRPDADLATATRGSRIAPRWFGWSGRRQSPTHRRRHERCLARGAWSDRSFPGSRGRRCPELRSGRSGLG